MWYEERFLPKLSATELLSFQLEDSDDTSLRTIGIATGDSFDEIRADGKEALAKAQSEKGGN